MTCGDVEEAELVGPRLVIGGSGLDGVAGIPEIDEVDALDDAALFHVEAGYDADFQHDDGVIAGPAQVCTPPVLDCDDDPGKQQNRERDGPQGQSAKREPADHGHAVKRLAEIEAVK